MEVNYILSYILIYIIYLVTLSGAHSVGHVHPEFSGFGHPESATMTTAQLDANPTLNAWDKSPDIFDNQYFQSLIGEVLMI